MSEAEIILYLSTGLFNHLSLYLSTMFFNRSYFDIKDDGAVTILALAYLGGPITTVLLLCVNFVFLLGQIMCYAKLWDFLTQSIGEKK